MTDARAKPAPHNDNSSVVDTAVVQDPFRRRHASFQKPIRAPLPVRAKPIRPVARSNPGSEFALAKQARKSVTKRQRAIKRLIANGQHKDAANKARQLFRSESGRRIAAARAKKKWKRQDADSRLSIEQLAELSADATVQRDVHACAKGKKSGNKDRIISQYGLLDRARQELLMLSYGQLLEFSDKQFSAPGKSAHMAVHYIAGLIRDPWYEFAVELDLTNFYESVDTRVLEERLGMPHWIVEEILTNQGKERRNEIRPSNARTHGKWTGIRPRTGCGLPEGPISSTHFALSLLKEALDRFSDWFDGRVEIVNYGDNFLLLAPSEDVMGWAIETLASLLEETAALVAPRTRSPIRRISDGFEFIGYRFMRRKGRPVISIPKQRQAAFARKLDQRIAEINDLPEAAKPQETEDLVRRTKGTLSYFKSAPQDALWAMRLVERKLCKLDNVQHTQSLLAFIEKHRPDEGRCRENQFGERRARFRDMHPISVPRAFSTRNMTPESVAQDLAGLRRAPASP